MPTPTATDLKKTLICNATGTFAQDYLIALEGGEEATVKFLMFREAEITIAGEIYRVLDEYSTKDGSHKGWKLTQNEELVAWAERLDSFWSRQLKVTQDQLSIELAATGFFTHGYEILYDYRVVGTLKSTYVRPLTRKITIECSPFVPLRLQLFSLVLCVNSWHRGSRSWF